MWIDVLLLEGFFVEKAINVRSLGVNVKRYREEKGITASKLAEITGMSVSHINNIESASTHASAEVLVRISNALGVPIDLLLCDSLTGEANRMARIMEYYTMLDGCDETESKIIMATLETLKTELRKARKG